MTINSSNRDQVDALLMLPAHEIGYDSLSADLLAGLACQTVDPFVATSALGELTQRGPDEAKVVAQHILDHESWDSHLTAFALTVLYDRDPEGGFQKMADLVDSCDDATVLVAMMDNVLSDAERFESTSWAPVARTIARRVASTDPVKFGDAEQRVEFVRRFGGSGPE